MTTIIENTSANIKSEIVNAFNGMNFGKPLLPSVLESLTNKFFDEIPTDIPELLKKEIESTNQIIQSSILNNFKCKIDGNVSLGVNPSVLEALSLKILQRYYCEDNASLVKDSELAGKTLSCNPNPKENYLLFHAFGSPAFEKWLNSAMNILYDFNAGSYSASGQNVKSSKFYPAFT
jgi:hypothetical protein